MSDNTASTPTPDYLTTLTEVYKYILGPEWGKEKPKDKPAKKAKEQDAKHHSPKAN